MTAGICKESKNPGIQKGRNTVGFSIKCIEKKQKKKSIGAARRSRGG